MIEVEGIVREWGRSLGIVLPKNSVEKEGIRKDDVVSILIAKKSNGLSETFGTLNFTRKTDIILRESDEEAWDE